VSVEASSILSAAPSFCHWPLVKNRSVVLESVRVAPLYAVVNSQHLHVMSADWFLLPMSHTSRVPLAESSQWYIVYASVLHCILLQHLYTEARSLYIRCYSLLYES